MAERPAPAAIARALEGSALNLALGQIGDRWTVLVILMAFLGVKRFDDLRARLNIPRQTLALRLRQLVAQGVLKAVPYQARPPRREYRLTAMGRALYPHALMNWRWEQRWGRHPLGLPDRLVHAVCGHTFMPKLVCATCDGAMTPADIDIALRIDAAPPAEIPGSTSARSLRWAGRLGGMTTRAQRDAQHLGLRMDRWAVLTLSCVMLGCHRFDALHQALGIGTSVLAGRLALMCDAKLLTKEIDRGDARRYVYRLTPSSRELLDYVFTLSRWATDHLPGADDTIVVTHRACGHRVLPKVVCDACGAEVEPAQVRFEFDPANADSQNSFAPDIFGLLS